MSVVWLLLCICVCMYVCMCLCYLCSLLSIVLSMVTIYHSCIYLASCLFLSSTAPTYHYTMTTRPTYPLPFHSIRRYRRRHRRLCVFMRQGRGANAAPAGSEFVHVSGGSAAAHRRRHSNHRRHIRPFPHGRDLERVPRLDAGLLLQRPAAGHVPAVGRQGRGGQEAVPGYPRKGSQSEVAPAGPAYQGLRSACGEGKVVGVLQFPLPLALSLPFEHAPASICDWLLLLLLPLSTYPSI